MIKTLLTTILGVNPSKMPWYPYLMNHGALDFKRMDNEFLTKFRKFYKERGNNETTTLKAVNTIVWFLN